MIFVAVGLVVVAGLVVALVCGNHSIRANRQGPSARQPSASKSPKKSTRKRRPRHGEPSWRGGTPPPVGPRTLADLMRQPDVTQPDEPLPIDNGTLAGHLRIARRAMAQRDLEAARRHTEAALEAAASTAEREEAGRVQNLLASLDSFWKSVREEAAQLQSGQEFHVRGKPVEVVQSGDAVLAIRVAGKPYRYSVRDMPQELAVHLAQRRMPPGDPLTELHIGAFLAVDARGDRQQARRRWQAAGDPGEALMPELELAPPVNP